MPLIKKIIFVGLLIAFIFPSFVFASIGVGVGVGKMELKEPLKPGGIYELPNLPVINTGTDPSDYEAYVQYHYKQPQLLPLRSWFEFSPREFYLEPGEVQIVKISIVVPVRAEPGDYFAYMEGRSIEKDTEIGGAKIGIAAAAKLYFTIDPASGFEGIRFRVVTILKKYSPWPQVSFAIISVALILFVLSKFLSLNLQVGRTKKKK